MKRTQSTITGESAATVFVDYANSERINVGKRLPMLAKDDDARNGSVSWNSG